MICYYINILFASFAHIVCFSLTYTAILSSQISNFFDTLTSLLTELCLRMISNIEVAHFYAIFFFLKHIVYIHFYTLSIVLCNLNGSYTNQQPKQANHFKTSSMRKICSLLAVELCIIKKHMFFFNEQICLFASSGLAAYMSG